MRKTSFTKIEKDKKMTKQKEPVKRILITLGESHIEALEDASRSIGLTKSTVLQLLINRDLAKLVKDWSL